MIKDKLIEELIYFKDVENKNSVGSLLTYVVHQTVKENIYRHNLKKGLWCYILEPQIWAMFVSHTFNFSDLGETMFRMSINDNTYKLKLEKMISAKLI